MTRIDDAMLWAARQRCVLETNGQIGFGRDCVGIIYATSYVETPGSALNDWPEGLHGPDDRLMPPDHVNAYHKGDYLCILGHGADALMQLLDWIAKLRRYDARIVVKPRDLAHLPGTDHPINWLLHGTERAVIEFPGGYRERHQPPTNREAKPS